VVGVRVQCGCTTRVHLMPHAPASFAARRRGAV